LFWMLPVTTCALYCILCACTHVYAWPHACSLTWIQTCQTWTATFYTRRTCAHISTPHTHTHTHIHAHTYTHKHTHTQHIHTHTQNHLHTHMYSSLPYINGYAMCIYTNESNYKYQFSYNGYTYVMNMHFNMKNHLNTTYV